MGKDKIIVICDRIILFSIYIIAFFFPISKSIIEIFSTLAIFCFIIKKVFQRQLIPKSRLNFIILVYLLIVFLSIFISSNFKISLRIFIGKTIQDILFFFVIVDALNSQRRLKWFLYILFLSSLLLGIDGIYQHFTHQDFIRHRPVIFINRIYATFPTPNDFGCYLTAVIPFILSCFFCRLDFRKSVRYLFAGLFILLFVCLMLTVSRGAWFAFISGILFMSIWIRSLGIFFLMLGFTTMLAQQFYYPLIKERLANLFVFEDLSSLDRVKIWQAAWKMFISKPLAGLGLGTFMFNFNKFIIEGYPYGITYAHNCYLQIAAETGIIGLAAFLAIPALFFYNGIKSVNTPRINFFWYVLLASIASVLGYCVQMTVDTTFYSLDLGLLFWILLGIGVVAMNNIRSGTLTPE